MRSGFPRNYTYIHPLGDQTGAEFLVIAQEAIQQLGWTVHQINQTSLLAYAPAGTAAVGDDIQITIKAQKAHLQSESMTENTVGETHHQQNIERLLQAMEAAQSQLSPEEMSQRMARLQATFQIEHTAEEPSGKSGFLALFIPSGDYFVTPVLVNLTILIFIAMALAGVGIFEPDTESLIRWGANFKPYTLNGGWWRLFTCVFIHIGLLHLAMNMYALVFIGSLLEPILGRMRFLAAYVCTGILASIASLWWHDATVSAGASGAIFGMYGVFLALLTTNHIEKEARKSLLGSISIFVVYSLLGGLRGGIDNAAHIGGLVAGIMVGYAFYPGLRYSPKSLVNYSSIAGLIFVTAGVAILVLQYTRDPLGEYDQRMKDFYARQTAALQIYNMPAGTPDEQILVSIRDTGLVNWKANLKLVRELEQLNLPEAIHVQNKKMIEYCELRVKSYELMYKAFKENTNIYENQIQVYDKRIEVIINELNKKPESK